MKTILIGAQFGDEGKGKMADVLAKHNDVVARYQGGANAGHTVYRDGQQYIFHMIPSGILHPGKICVIGNGCVVDVEGLRSEMAGLEERGVSFGGRFYVSDRATLILPYHKSAEKYETRVGTTRRGIGPAYTSRRNRSALTLGDVNEFLRNYSEGYERYVIGMIESDLRLHGIEGEPPGILDSAACQVEGIGDFVADTQHLLHSLVSDGRSILLEGAQGTFLDIDHGTYPFVTSSGTTVGGAYSGTGLPPAIGDMIIGVAKAYITRVGNGHLPTEQKNSYGEAMRKGGNEFGSTTGRPRRCGWFDVPLARKASEINGFGSVALTKLDVLDALPEVPVCTSYEIDGRESDFPSTGRRFEMAHPVYTTLPGWQSETSGMKEWKDLPDNAKRYVEFLENMMGVRISYVSTGPGEDDIIFR